MFLFKKLKRSVGYKTMGHFHQQDIAVNTTMLATTIEIKEDGRRGDITVNTTMQHMGGGIADDAGREDWGQSQAG